LIHALRKEMLLQWRTRAQMMAVFVFGAASLLLFSFAVGPNAEMLRQFSAGFMWLGLLLSSTLTLAESFHAEMENRALEGL
jgi:heme exporter protein B